MTVDLKEKHIPFFADPDISEERKRAAREKGGRLGGRPTKFEDGLAPVEIDDLKDVLGEYLALLAQAKRLDRSAKSVNSIRAILNDIAELLLLVYEKSELDAQLKGMAAELGVEYEA